MPLVFDDIKIAKKNWIKEGGYVLAMFWATDDSLANFVLEEDFALPIPPTEYEDSEEPGTFIQPTQRTSDPTFHLEVTGLQTKTISLSGTTGIFPKRSVLQLLPPAVQAAARELSTLSGGGPEDTGFFFFHALHKLILRYHALQSSESVPGAVQLRFFNLKDQEYYVVEPLSFRRRRMAGRPMQYFYSLQMRVVGKTTINAAYKAKLEGGGLDAVLTTAGRITRWVSYVSQLAGNVAMLTAKIKDSVSGLFTSLQGSAISGIDALGNTATMMDAMASQDWWTSRAQTYGQQLARENKPQLGKGSYQSRERVRQKVAAGAMTALAAKVMELPPPTPASSKRFFLGPQGKTTTITNELRKTVGKLGRLTPFGDLDPNGLELDLLGRMLEQQRVAYVLVDTAPFDDADLSAAAQQLEDWIHLLVRASEGENYASNAALLTALAKAKNDKLASPAEPIGTGLLKGAPTALQTIDLVAPADAERFRQLLGVRDPRTYSGIYRRIRVERGETPESVSAKHMGAWTRWPELVALNGLVAPYFTDDGAPGTVQYGGQLLVPVDQPGINAVDLKRIEEMKRRFDKLSSTDVLLGLDILADTDSGDLRVMPGSPDCEVVAGAQAFAQGIRMRLEMTAGSWLPRPNLGLGIEPGQKASPLALALWEAVTEIALRSDPRISRVTDIETTLEGSVLRQNIRLELIEVEESLTVSVALP